MPMTRATANIDDPETAYVPSPAFIKLIADIANAPTLELRSWAGVTLATTMASDQPSSVAEQQAVGAVSKALSARYEIPPDTVGSYDDASDDGGSGAMEMADLMLAVMAVDDVGARRVALEALVHACVGHDDIAAAVAHGAVRRFIGWVDQENRTRH